MSLMDEPRALPVRPRAASALQYASFENAPALVYPKCARSNSSARIRSPSWQSESTALPIFHDFGAGACGNALDHLGHEAVHHFFFQQLAADVHAGSAGRGNPQFRDLVIGVHLESVDQAELLNRAHGDRGENAQIRHDRENPAQPKSRALTPEERPR